jgi:ribosomal-protein-alanine N-acetyltransferase
VQLETERLLLRELTDDDFDALYRMNSDSEVMRYVGRGKTQNREEVEVTLQRYKDLPNKHPGFYIWAAVEKASDEVTGLIFLLPYAPTSEVEVGYRFLPEFWNKGYATEGTKVALEYGFEQLGLDRIIAIAYPENLASIRVMEKAGLHSEGTIFNDQLGIDIAYHAIEKEG